MAKQNKQTKLTIIILRNGKRGSELFHLRRTVPGGLEAARVHLTHGPCRVQKQRLAHVKPEVGPQDSSGVAGALDDAGQLETGEDLPHSVGLCAPRVLHMIWGVSGAR